MNWEISFGVGNLNDIKVTMNNYLIALRQSICYVLHTLHVKLFEYTNMTLNCSLMMFICSIVYNRTSVYLSVAPTYFIRSPL
jgi:hypothetical protein